MSHQKKKDRQNQSTTSEHANTNHTPERRITPQRDKKKKRKTTRHIPSLTSQHHPAIPADTQTRIQSLPHTSFLHPCRHPFLHPIRIPSTRLLTPATIPCPHTACRHCTHHLLYRSSSLYHHPCLHYCSQLYPCLSRSRYRSPSTCVPLPDGRYATHHLLSIMLACTVYSANAICILFTCLSALLCSPCYSTPPTVLGSATLLTTIHRPHPLRVTPAACATTSPLRESTHTPCRFHHPYRSLTLAHRVVPPLVVPVPSLAVSGVRLFFMVPLVGESPLADARLPPHPNGHLLLAKRSPTHHAPLLASTPLYAYMSAFLHPCLPPVLSTPCLQYFIQSCQHDAACIVHQIRQSPQPPVQHICTHKGAQCASVSEYQAHVCIYAC